MQIHLIRHAQTQSNLERRYTGSSDVPTLAEALARLNPADYPQVERVYVSPMLRCRQTAAQIYPTHTAVMVDDLRESSFGEFEGKTFEELKDTLTYRAWVEGKGAPPGGEASDVFRQRCCKAFEKLVTADFVRGTNSASYVVHGGVIMALMERFAIPARAFYEWRPENGAGWSAHIDEKTWNETLTISVIGEIGNR